MGNKNIIEYYNKLAKSIKDPKATRNKAKDFSKYDIGLMKSFADKNKTLLDLGSGTGLLINHLVDDFKAVTAIEKYPEFSEFIRKSPNIEVINMDLLEFKVDCCFDYVSLFGVMNYFNKEEAIIIYEKALYFLKEEGKLIVKNQMGIDDDVVVDGFSEELQTNYYSEYRHIDKEVALLKSVGFGKVDILDIYPKEYNRWNNTHFYALICKKV